MKWLSTEYGRVGVLETVISVTRNYCKWPAMRPSLVFKPSQLTVRSASFYMRNHTELHISDDERWGVTRYFSTVRFSSDIWWKYWRNNYRMNDWTGKRLKGYFCTNRTGRSYLRTTTTHKISGCEIAIIEWPGEDSRLHRGPGVHVCALVSNVY